jgi:hypothetical protein
MHASHRQLIEDHAVSAAVFAQELFWFLPPEAQQHVGEKLRTIFSATLAHAIQQLTGKASKPGGPDLYSVN